MAFSKRTLTFFGGITCFLILAGLVPVDTPPTPNVAFVAAHEAITLNDEGEKVYNSRCMSCHQMDGKGIPGVFPPLNESEFVQGSPERLVRIILQGMMGEVTIKGVTYSGMMPPWGTFLSDEEIAAVVTYVRANFDNEASEVNAEEVAEIRAATTDRKQPWTAEELEPFAEDEHSEGDSAEGDDGR